MFAKGKIIKKCSICDDLSNKLMTLSQKMR